MFFPSFIHFPSSSFWAAAGGKKMKLFMILFFLFNFGILCYGFNPPRIWNGTAVSPETYPNIPRLHGITMKSKNGTPVTYYDLCTGSIISPRHILTAAHCVYTVVAVNETHGYTAPLQGFIVDVDKIDPNFRGPIDTKMLLHEHGIAVNFTSHEWNMIIQVNLNDLAIIEFPKGTNFGITPMVLAKNYVEGDNDIAIALGYGDDNPHPNITGFPTSLIKGEIPVIKDCAWKNINDKLLCAGTKTTRVDHGDSGGPLVISRNDELYQIGIVHGGSYVNGTPANHDSDFGIFTRVSAYCDWIEEKTNSEAKCVEIPPLIPAPLPTPNALNEPATTPPNGDVGISYQIFYPVSCFFLTLIIAF